jgi:hypothetical protein
VRAHASSLQSRILSAHVLSPSMETIAPPINVERPGFESVVWPKSVKLDGVESRGPPVLS